MGGIFGVGFLREYIKKSYAQMIHEIITHHEDQDQETIEAFLTEFQNATIEQKSSLLKQLKKKNSEAHLSKKERSAMFVSPLLLQ